MSGPTKLFLRILAAQVAALGFFVLAIWLIEPNWVASAFWGGFIFILPNAYFSLYAFPSAKVREPHVFIRAFLKGHTGKMVLAATGFALVYRFVEHLHAPSLFISYCFLMVVNLIVATKLSNSLVKAD